MYGLLAHSVVSSHCVLPIFVTAILLMHCFALYVWCMSFILSVSMYILIHLVPISF